MFLPFNSKMILLFFVYSESPWLFVYICNTPPFCTEEIPSPRLIWVIIFLCIGAKWIRSETVSIDGPLPHPRPTVRRPWQVVSMSGWWYYVSYLLPIGTRYQLEAILAESRFAFEAAKVRRRCLRVFDRSTFHQDLEYCPLTSRGGLSKRYHVLKSVVCFLLFSCFCLRLSSRAAGIPFLKNIKQLNSLVKRHKISRITLKNPNYLYNLYLDDCDSVGNTSV